MAPSLYELSGSNGVHVLDWLGQSYRLSKLDVAAEPVRKLHLARSLAFGLEEAGISDKNARAFCA